MTQAIEHDGRTADDGGEDVVVLTVPAEGAYLSVLRTATAGLAARLHFTLDEIEDLRIAVDEACAMLLPGLPGGTTLTCRFDVAETALSVAVSAPAHPDRQLPGTQTFAWQVLTALAGHVESEQSDTTATIRLVKRRSAA